ncbi:MAG: transposase [Methylocella sp.]
MLLRRVDECFGLTSAVAAALNDPRESLSHCPHSMADWMAQRIDALRTGYEDLNDHNRLVTIRPYKRRLVSTRMRLAFPDSFSN